MTKISCHMINHQIIYFWGKNNRPESGFDISLFPPSRRRSCFLDVSAAASLRPSRFKALWLLRWLQLWQDLLVSLAMGGGSKSIVLQVGRIVCLYQVFVFLVQSTQWGHILVSCVLPIGGIFQTDEMKVFWGAEHFCLPWLSPANWCS